MFQSGVNLFNEKVNQVKDTVRLQRSHFTLTEWNKSVKKSLCKLNLKGDFRTCYICTLLFTFTAGYMQNDFQ